MLLIHQFLYHFTNFLKFFSKAFYTKKCPIPSTDIDTILNLVGLSYATSLSLFRKISFALGIPRNDCGVLSPS